MHIKCAPLYVEILFINNRNVFTQFMQRATIFQQVLGHHARKRAASVYLPEKQQPQQVFLAFITLWKIITMLHTAILYAV